MSVSTLGVLVGKGSFGRVYLAPNNETVTKVFDKRTDWIVELERVHRVTEYFYKWFGSRRDWPLPLVREGKCAGFFREPKTERIKFTLETEAVLGGTLRMATIARPLSVRNAVLVAGQLLEAVQCLQHCGLAHLDISHHNVMFHGPDRGGRVVLVDLGMSRELGKVARMGTEYVRTARCVQMKNTNFMPSVYTDIESLCYVVMEAMGLPYAFILEHKLDLDQLEAQFLPKVLEPEEELVRIFMTQMLRYAREKDHDHPDTYEMYEPAFATLKGLLGAMWPQCDPPIHSFYDEIRI